MKHTNESKQQTFCAKRSAYVKEYWAMIAVYYDIKRKIDWAGTHNHTNLKVKKARQS